jgi:hypothetical protein
MADTFSVVNFARFQHYKDRSPPWIKFYNSTLSDYAYCKLPDASKAHLNAIWLLASRNMNKIPYDAEWLKAQISATENIDLQILEDSGFIVSEQGCSKTLATRKQSAALERERETEERESREEKKEYGAEAPCDFKEEWNLLADRVGLSKIRGKVSESRRRSWHKHFGNGSGDRWRQILALIEASEFCQGSTGWRATFDWVLKPVNAQKVIEGNYGNHEPKETESDVYRAARELAQELEDGEVGIVDATGGVGAEADRDDGRNKTVLARVPGGVGGFHAGRVGSSDQAGEEGLEVLPSDSRPVGGIKTDVEGDG